MCWLTGWRFLIRLNSWKASGTAATADDGFREAMRDLAAFVGDASRLNRHSLKITWIVCKNAYWPTMSLREQLGKRRALFEYDPQHRFNKQKR